MDFENDYIILDIASFNFDEEIYSLETYNSYF